MSDPELARALEPCPFCGGTRIGVFTVRDGRQVMCKDCHAKSGPKFFGPENLPTAEHRAIAAWNTRSQAAEVERLNCEKAMEIGRAMDAEERAASLAERVRLLEGALAPFVAFIEKADGPVLHVTGHGESHMGPGLMANSPNDYVLLRPDPSIPPLKLGHFRAARSAMEG